MASGGGPKAHASSEAGRPDRSKPLMYPFCDDVSKYEKITKVGQGTFGEVWKAKHSVTKQPVALKKVLMENEKEGFPLTALREMKILQKLHNENVVKLIEICRGGKTAPYARGSHIYLVFEFCEHDLAGLLSNPAVQFSHGEIKTVIQQLLNALFFLHTHRILHRDIKAANILITKGGTLKLADFGLARAFSSNKEKQRYTSRVVTLWYRPPELLLGERDYGPPIDVWGVGCIMAEMWTRAPILQGRSEQQQLNLIICLCGSINEETYPNCTQLPLYGKMELPTERRKVKDRLRKYVKDASAIDLIDKLLTLDPAQRATSDHALNHDFFWGDPLPTPLANVLSTLSKSNFEFLAPRRGGVGGHPGVAPSAGGLPAGGGNGRGPGHHGSGMPMSNFNSASFDHVF